MDLGNLVATRRGKTYSGVSDITHKTLYRVSYKIFFYRENEKVIGYLADDKPFTFSIGFNKRTEAEKFLKDNGYTMGGWER